jgi:NTP pyrophosphatase (non-canonical NTP hydrolase)
LTSYEKVAVIYWKRHYPTNLLVGYPAAHIFFRIGIMHISEFQQLICEKYKKRDLQRGVPATFMWFIEEVGELATALASNNEQNRQEEFADVFAWLCTLANISGVDLEKACEKYTGGKVKGFKPK